MSRILLSLTLAFALLPLHAAGEEAPAVSLLTCSGGAASYEAFGHTALRVEEGGRDVAYNFGIFDFRAPHFVWRFVLGRTDYMLRAEPTDRFLYGYLAQGRSVVEQRLALSPAEASRVARTLDSLAADPHWTYRYNFLRDNCTTRALRVVERSLDGRIVWPGRIAGQPATLREVIDSCSAGSPWNAFGQDLLLGSEVDRPATREALMFSPLLASAFVQDARIVGPGGTERPLVAEVRRAGVPAGGDAGSRLPGPTAVMAVLALFGLAFTADEARRRRRRTAARVFDAALLLAQGLAGSIIFVLFFFSAHPAVDSNRLIILLNPLPFVWLALALAARLRGRCFPAMAPGGVLALLWLADGLLAGAQTYPPAMVLAGLLLLVRGAADAWLYRLNLRKKLVRR